MDEDPAGFGSQDELGDSICASGVKDKIGGPHANVREGKRLPLGERKEPRHEPTAGQIAAETPVQSSDKGNEDPVSKVGGWLTAISLAGVLAGTGFIARFSREQFLGISLGDWSVQNLGLLAGRCGIDSLLLPLAFLLHNWVVVLSCVAVPLISAAIVTVFHERPRVETALRACGLLTLFAALFMVLLRYEAPTIQLHDWITGGSPTAADSGFGAVPSSPTFRLIDSYIEQRYDDLCKLLIASKLPTFDPKTGTLPDGTRVAALSCSGTSPVDASDQIQAQYSICILVCLGSWVYLAVLGNPDRSALSGRILYRAELVVLGPLVLVSVFIPYMYGKLISSTEFPVADISYREPPRNSKLDKISSVEVPLIAAGDKDISVLSIDAGVAKVVQIPRDHLFYLHIYSKMDILRTLLEQRALASAKVQAP